MKQKLSIRVRGGSVLKKFAWNLYGRYAWDDNRTESDFFQLIVQQIKRSGTSLNILDAGCGSGQHAEILANLKHRATGIDFSSAMIRKARERLNEETQQYLDFQIHDLNDPLSFPDLYFDWVICISALQQVQNPDNTLQEFHRVLKQQGTVLLVHYPPYLKNKSLGEEVEDKFGRSKNKTLTGNLLLYAKSLLERMGFTKYWETNELVEMLTRANYQSVKLLSMQPIIITGRKSGQLSRT